MENQNIVPALIISAAILLAALIASPAKEKPWIWRESPTELRLIYNSDEIYRITGDSKIDYKLYQPSL